MNALETAEAALKKSRTYWRAILEYLPSNSFTKDFIIEHGHNFNLASVPSYKEPQFTHNVKEIFYNIELLKLSKKNGLDWGPITVRDSSFIDWNNALTKESFKLIRGDIKPQQIVSLFNQGMPESCLEDFMKKLNSKKGQQYIRGMKTDRLQQLSPGFLEKHIKTFMSHRFLFDNITLSETCLTDNFRLFFEPQYNNDCYEEYRVCKKILTKQFITTDMIKANMEIIVGGDTKYQQYLQSNTKISWEEKIKISELIRSYKDLIV